MSRGMKIYAATLVAIVFVIAFNILYEPSEVRELNALLAQEEQLKDYPYQFRVLQIDNGVAVISSPRAAGVSVPAIVKVIDPSLKDLPVTDERIFEAQRHLAEIQSSAKRLIEDRPNVERIRWKLDEEWLRNHGIAFPH